MQQPSAPPASWIKRITYIFLVSLGLFLPISGGWWYSRQYAELRASGLDGPVFLVLILIGLSGLIMPFQLRQKLPVLSAPGLVREFLWRWGLILAGTTAVILFFTLITLILTLPGRLDQPHLLLPWLLMLVPLVAILADLWRGTVVRSLSSLVLGYLYYAFRLIGLVLLQLSTAFLAFALFPAGIFLQLLSGIDLIARQLGRFAGDLPIICSWSGVDAEFCTPVLITFHLGHLLLTAAALLWGLSAFNLATDWYAHGLRALQRALQPNRE